MLSELLQVVGHFLADFFGLTTPARNNEENGDRRRVESARESIRSMLPYFLIGSVVLLSLSWYLFQQIEEGINGFFDAPWWGPSTSGGENQ